MPFDDHFHCGGGGGVISRLCRKLSSFVVRAPHPHKRVLLRDRLRLVRSQRRTRREFAKGDPEFDVCESIGSLGRPSSSSFLGLNEIRVLARRLAAAAPAFVPTRKSEEITGNAQIVSVQDSTGRQEPGGRGWERTRDM